jgi:sorbitol-specific phosphotransferase system component IIC
METGASGSMMMGMLAGTIVMLITLVVLVTAGVRLVLQTEKRRAAVEGRELDQCA